MSYHLVDRGPSQKKQYLVLYILQKPLVKFIEQWAAWFAVNAHHDPDV